MASKKIKEIGSKEKQGSTCTAEVSLYLPVLEKKDLFIYSIIDGWLAKVNDHISFVTGYRAKYGPVEDGSPVSHEDRKLMFDIESLMPEIQVASTRCAEISKHGNSGLTYLSEYSGEEYQTKRVNLHMFSPKNIAAEFEEWMAYADGNDWKTGSGSDVFAAQIFSWITEQLRNYEIMKIQGDAD